MRLTSPNLLIDGDILCYRASSATDGRMYEVKYKEGEQIVTICEKYKKDADAAATAAGENLISLVLTFEPEPLSHALHNLKQLILSLEGNISKYTDGTPVHMYFLSRGGSFRESACPTYKTNREGMRRPEHLEACKDYLLSKRGAVVMEGKYEADDLMAMNQTSNSVICSVDKDLLQVPGHHFNFVKNEYKVVSEVQGLIAFYSQLLTGDDSDGIVGLRGVGPKTALKLLKGLRTPFAMWATVLKEWLQRTPREDGEPDEEFYSRVLNMLHMNAKLLYLLRSPEDAWVEPVYEG